MKTRLSWVRRDWKPVLVTAEIKHWLMLSLMIGMVRHCLQVTCILISNHMIVI